MPDSECGLILACFFSCRGKKDYFLSDHQNNKKKSYFKLGVNHLLLLAQQGVVIVHFMMTVSRDFCCFKQRYDYVIKIQFNSNICNILQSSELHFYIDSVAV